MYNRQILHILTKPSSKSEDGSLGAALCCPLLLTGLTPVVLKDGSNFNRDNNVHLSPSTGLTCPFEKAFSKADIEKGVLKK